MTMASWSGSGTLISAHEHGYHVTLVTDAMTDSSAAAHDHSVKHVFPMLGQRATTEEILQQLSSRGLRVPHITYVVLT